MLAVIDTNVLFEGLTRKGGAAGLIVDAWLAGVYVPCVSSALAYEYLDVLSRKLAERRWLQLRPVLVAMLRQAQFIEINFTWRPSSRDPDDDHVIDCAMNANAALVTANLRDFHLAQRALGLNVMSPAEFVSRIVQ